MQLYKRNHSFTAAGSAAHAPVSLGRSAVKLDNLSAPFACVARCLSKCNLRESGLLLRIV